jgi:hypothetical protein
MSGRCGQTSLSAVSMIIAGQLAVGTGDVHRGFAEIWFVLAKSDQHPAFWLSHATVCSAENEGTRFGRWEPARVRSRASVSSRALTLSRIGQLRCRRGSR